MSIKWLFTLLMWPGRPGIVQVVIIVMGAIKGIQDDPADNTPSGNR